MAKIRCISRTTVPCKKGEITFYRNSTNESRQCVNGEAKDIVLEFDGNLELVSIVFNGEDGLKLVDKVLCFKKKGFLF